MKKHETMKRISLILLILFLASLACRVEAPKIIMEESPTPLPPVVVVITEVATEVITPTALPHTLTPEPTLTPTLEPTTTWDPVNAPIYYPLEGCAASRLYVGDQAFVSLIGGPNGIRTSADVHEGEIVAYAQPGAILDIIAGPWCSWGWVVWMVRMADGYVGFTPEGNGYEYWLFPLNP